MRWRGDEVADAMKLCVSCKACRRECPTGVDMAKMKIEVLAARAERHGVRAARLDHRRIATYRALSRRASRRSPICATESPRCAGRPNGGSASPPSRPLPAWSRDPFRDAEADAVAPARPRGEVLLLADTFNRYFEPDNLRAAVRVLRGRRIPDGAAGAEGPSALLRPHLACCRADR